MSKRRPSQRVRAATIFLALRRQLGGSKDLARIVTRKVFVARALYHEAEHEPKPVANFITDCELCGGRIMGWLPKHQFYFPLPPLYIIPGERFQMVLFRYRE